jgi:hypothetical protein
LDIKIDYSRIPGKEWKWNENEIGYEGVNTFDKSLKWFTYRNALGGNSLTVKQTFEDFLKDGPLRESIPADALIEIYDVIMGAVENDSSGGTKY